MLKSAWWVQSISWIIMALGGAVVTVIIGAVLAEGVSLISLGLAIAGVVLTCRDYNNIGRRLQCQS